MVEIITERLLLVPCSLDIAKSLIFFRPELEEKSPISIPADWPSSLVTGMLPYFIENLEKDHDEFMWGLWMIILHYERKIIGDILFFGKPDAAGTVYITYHLSQQMKDISLAFEAMDAILEWVIGYSDVKKIVMECSDKNVQSIKLFEKLGFRCEKKEGQFLTWALEKAV